MTDEVQKIRKRGERHWRRECQPDPVTSWPLTLVRLRRGREGTRVIKTEIVNARTSEVTVKSYVLDGNRLVHLW